MKHIKKFNESIYDTIDIKELENICNDHLAYFNDDNKFDISLYKSKVRNVDTLITIRHSIELYYNWDNIKDDVLSLVNVLEDIYFISDVYFTTINNYKFSLLKRGFIKDTILLSDEEIDFNIKNSNTSMRIKEFIIEIKNKK